MKLSNTKEENMSREELEEFNRENNVDPEMDRPALIRKREMEAEKRESDARKYGESPEIGIDITIIRNGEEVTQKSTSDWDIAEQNLASLRRQFEKQSL